MKRSRANGWGIFAATMLFVAGAVNIVQGIVAMAVPEYFVAAEGEILVFGFLAWGIILGIWGVVLVATGAAVMSGRMWARAAGVVFAAVNAFAQLAFVDAHPVWSLVVFAVDVLIVYGLTAGWPDREQPETGDAYAAGRADAQAAPAATGAGEAGGERSSETGAGTGAGEREGERPVGGASTQEARQAAMERPPGTRPGKHEQPMS